MRTITRPLMSMLAAVAGLALCLAFTAQTAEAAPVPPATWDLADDEQRFCVPADQPHRYFILGAVAGSWDAPLTAELRDLPEGASLVSYTDSVPPGDNGAEHVVVLGFLIVLPGLEYGEHHAALHVTDGTVSQTMPIVFDAGDGWSC